MPLSKTRKILESKGFKIIMEKIRIFVCKKSKIL